MRESWCRREAQVVLGRWIFVLQFRRPAMSVLSRSWEAIRDFWCTKGQRLTLESELLTLIGLAPLLQTDLRSEYDGEVTCSDASETGGAASRAVGLTWSGRSLTRMWTQPNLRPIDIPVLVLSLFNGVGGAFRVYDVLGCNVAGRISVECFKPANRTCRTAWPDLEEIHNVHDVTLEMIRGWANRFGHIAQLHLWGGFPCIHLSSVRAFRRNLCGEGSDLFWVMLDILRVVYEVFGSFCTVKFCVENVASMDAAARQEISKELDVQPVKLDPSDNMPFSRPRLAWCSEALYPMDGLTLEEENDYIRAYAEGPEIKEQQWIRPGWKWQPEDARTRFPTFMKSIRRQRPPPVPAGLHRTSQATRLLWEENNFRYPPYQFRPEFLLHCPGKDSRVLDCTEREILLGLGPGHTASCMSASELKRKPTEYLDTRDSLCGDSFAISSFAIMGAQMCADLVPRMGPSQIVQRLGLAPGATAHPSITVPLTRWLAYGGQEGEVTSKDLVQCLGLTTNHTGMDVQLNSGSLLGKRTAHASVKALWWQWKSLFSVHWRESSHINFLEMKMILLSLLWKTRVPSAVGKRWLHLEDSMVCLYILSKGRTSSHLLQPICRQIGAVQIAMSSTLLHAHVGSAENPTDAASRQ